MDDAMRKKRSAVITIIGMIAMTAFTVLKTVFSFKAAGAALVLSGLAFFFVEEAVTKTPDAESGFRFRTFFTDFKKPGVILIIVIMLLLTPAEMLLSKLLFGRAYVDHVLARTNLPDISQLPLLLISQIFTVAAEEIGFRGFFLGKGMKHFPFLPMVLLSALIFSAAHYAAGPATIVAWDLSGIFIDAILLALIYKKSGNCLICCIPHFLNNIIGLFLVPVIFG
ncbi:MAG: CPBP family intramembrane metalloprotease [Oscillospiraceae bacterium]|nr:CPBP family intramembrane metalloprotease [Oscillospiraceae bacterium]